MQPRRQVPAGALFVDSDIAFTRMPAKKPTGDWRWLEVPCHQLTDDKGEEQEEDGQHGECHPVLGDQNPVL